MKNIKQTDVEIYDIIKSELKRQRNTLELIASENFASYSVIESTGSILTNKYAEGYPGKRYYGGCESVDMAEDLARDRLKELFNAEYANVQPHSGSQANMGVFNVFLNHMDTVMGLDLAHGGHLTHGSKVNFSGNMYNFISYSVLEETGRVNFDEVWEKAKKYKPKLIICGGSAYPRFVEFEKFKEVADSIGAHLMGDVAHPSGLIAAGVHPSPWPYCDVITSTTHKTLRGPRGGMILLGKDFENPWNKIAPKSGRIKMVSELLDSSIMPGIQGGPLMHVIAAKAVAFKEALTDEFKEYSKQIVRNAKAIADEMLKLDYKLISGGTDTHLILVDLSDIGVSGKMAENKLEDAGITVNKNMVPFDKKSPMITSGIRIGTPAVTTRGMKEKDMTKIAKFIDQVLKNPSDEQNIRKIKHEVNEFCASFPIYEDL
ncbi:MAG: serine hydroxymethyltransferase [Candidatus Marinimicrobia bacterium]|nr:serine hydroxymethyltransferase [Candidatus Neomarinimicrobiota bacterium]